MKRLFISFSGGETSAYMTKLLLKKYCHLWDEIVVGFANTTRENKQTLEFVNRCDRRYGFNTVWLEAEVVHGERVACGHRVVSYETVSNDGVVFEEMIKKYGIPNTSFPHCTRELKLNPMLSYLKSVGWARGTYDTAVGIRSDEARRRAKNHLENRIIYPLLDFEPTTKPQINKHWMSEPFRLELTGYQGNCKNCFKKSDPKLLMIMDESPEHFDFTDAMEEKYGGIGPEFSKVVATGYRRVFFRKSRSSKDMRALYDRTKSDLCSVINDAAIFPDEDADGCSESCEVNFDPA